MNALLWVLLFASAPAPAAKPAPAPTAATVEKARGLFLAGSEAYRRGRYQVAVDAFSAARALIQRSAVSFSLAQASRLQYFINGDPAHLARAVAMYRAYLDEAPTGGRREHAAEHLAVLGPMLERRRAQGSRRASRAERRKSRIIVSSGVANATARLGDAPPQEIPATFIVKPGPVRVIIEAPEHESATITTVAVAGAPVPLNVTLKPLPALVTLTAPPGAQVFLDGLDQGFSPLPGPLRVPAGRHSLAVIDQGRAPFLRDVELARGERTTVQVKLVTSRQRIVAYSLFGVVGGLLTGSAVALGVAMDSESQARDIEDQFALRALTVGESRRYAALENERDDRRAWGMGLGIAAGAVFSTGLLLWLYDTPEPPHATRAPQPTK
jgi:hypothetical protein